MITTTACGKLYLAGEYAVVHAGYPAVLMAVDRFVTASIKPASTGKITSAQTTKTQFFSNYDHRITIFKTDPYFEFVNRAQIICEQFIKSQKKPARCYKLAINSQLNAKSGQKFGLGSSAAVTVAVTKAILKFYQVKCERLTIYKLAALAHYQTQQNGSLGDVAASVYGGFLAYRSPDRHWLLEQLSKVDIATLVQVPWKDLTIMPLAPLNDLAVLVGWTSCPASTKQLVQKVEQSRCTEAFQQFLAATDGCVSALIDAWQHHDVAKIIAHIIQNRRLLQQLANIAEVTLETPQLKELSDLAEQSGGAGKLSGAGGGDCGIALIAPQSKSQLIAAWQKHSITVLPLHVAILKED